MSQLRHLIKRAVNTLCGRRPPPEIKPKGSDAAELRLLVVANAVIPTVQLSLMAPLAEAIAQGRCRIEMLTEQKMKERFGKNLRTPASWEWTKEQVISAKPTHLIFCRYSGPHADALLELSRQLKIPSIYIIDDDLLNVPKELGPQKYDYHNHPLRTGAVRALLNNTDIAYCSNARLMEHLKTLKLKGNFEAGKIFCAGEVISKPELRQVKCIGYMGFDHAHDFEIALPALTRILRKYPSLRFELFGKIPKPAVLDEFVNRIEVLPVIPDYSEFLAAFAQRKWDIGICPLARTDFNKVKNINKWIEYSSVGAAVVASRGMIYDECCADECGMLADDADWEACLTELIENSEVRFELVRNAQARIVAEYSLERQAEQLLKLLAWSENVHMCNQALKHPAASKTT